MPETSLLAPFGINPGTAELVRLTQGYINQTYAVDTPRGREFILQQINPSVFPDIAGLMRNLRRALPFLQASDYRALELLETQEGTALIRDPRGRPWRVFRYIPDSTTFEATDQPGIASEAGRIIGRFHQLTSAARPGDFIEVLPRFHHLGYRLNALERAGKTADAERSVRASDALALAGKLADACRDIPFEQIPVRLCHNDTKLSNILFNSRDNRALCLIDLDTLMPGYLTYDLGDALRTLLQPLPENHPEPGAIRIQPEMFQAFLSGLRSSGLHMTQEEKEALPLAAVYMPLLHGVRALTDYLIGDVYYRTEVPDENLIRGQNLLHTARAVLDRQKLLEGIQKDCLP